MQSNNKDELPLVQINDDTPLLQGYISNTKDNYSELNNLYKSGQIPASELQARANTLTWQNQAEADAALQDQYRRNWIGGAMNAASVLPRLNLPIQGALVGGGMHLINGGEYRDLPLAMGSGALLGKVGGDLIKGGAGLVGGLINRFRQPAAQALEASLSREIGSMGGDTVIGSQTAKINIPSIKSNAGYTPTSADIPAIPSSGKYNITPVNKYLAMLANENPNFFNMKNKTGLDALKSKFKELTGEDLVINLNRNSQKIAEKVNQSGKANILGLYYPGSKEMHVASQDLIDRAKTEAMLDFIEDGVFAPSTFEDAMTEIITTKGVAGHEAMHSFLSQLEEYAAKNPNNKPTRDFLNNLAKIVSQNTDPIWNEYMNLAGNEMFPRTFTNALDPTTRFRRQSMPSYWSPFGVNQDSRIFQSARDTFNKILQEETFKKKFGTSIHFYD